MPQLFKGGNYCLAQTPKTIRNVFSDVVTPAEDKLSVFYCFILVGGLGIDHLLTQGD